MSDGSGKTMIAKDALETFAAALLEAGGFRPDYARQTAELLVWANLRGAESHGVLRIPRYVEMVEQGIVNGRAEPKFARQFGAIAVIEGDRVPGASGMIMTSDHAVALAGQFGIGLCSIMHTSHAGAVGYFAERVTRSGKIGLVMSASKPLMVYHGSRTEGVSTNPLAIGVPADDPDRPILLDMSTAAVALGKILAAKDAGKPIPQDWAVDANGVATTDPAKVKAVLPMAGPKGSGLSLMIEILVSVLGGNPLISRALLEKQDAGFNGLVVAIDPMAFGLEKAFGDEVEQLAHAIRSLPPADDAEQIWLPGERGYKESLGRLARGIPIAPGTVDRLIKEAGKRQVPVPDEFHGHH